MSADDHVPTPTPATTIPARPAEGATDQPTGQWGYELASERWWWSPETYRIHGFEPHEVVPTTALVLAHKHPQDRERFRATLETAKRSAVPFHSVHRIMTARGRERVVAFVGQGRRDAGTGAVLELMGFFVDVTAPVEQRAAAMAGEQIRAAAEHRGTIEQAKGILSATHGLTIDEAFQMLRGASNHHNVPIRELARRLVDLLGSLPPDADRPGCVDEFLSDPPRDAPLP